MRVSEEAIEMVRERLTALEHQYAEALERAACASRTAESLRTRMNALRVALGALGEGDDESAEPYAGQTPEQVQAAVDAGGPLPPEAGAES